MTFTDSELLILGTDLGHPLVEEVFAHLGSVDALAARLSATPVVVTGGGGSIGGAVVLALLGDPARTAPVTVIDTAERSLASLSNWARAQGLASVLTTIVADVSDREQMELVFGRITPSVVVHAAAVKHVSTCEQNPLLAERVNVGATRILLELAVAAGCERFVLVSTDKATSRVNVLGSTKYDAEVEVARVAAGTGLSACSVRLPNVWGSSGSVIELWRQAISMGLPVALYGPETTRYYQSVHDTVRVLLTAATVSADELGGSGDTLVVAEAVELSLREVFERVTGGEAAHTVSEPRPGEVAHELLLSPAEQYSDTVWPGILRLGRAG
ncbi:polysaccharide biosynthesis protein [Herbiconiux moechotypicola]|uniref:Polysaccharide biosynthesis protein CapD-like domain-containing protein n=1 Tax=Herbiconiux moechotypicola TaxID=637393 RepID=A0ABP5QUK1_9MICO|nr:polysaccharide biosynthesis protein [Herbiconiux moechotypicola]MCS5730996.1 polysaccharide biosynthesis protein [Herbiconiux moechotypicola]